MLLMLIISSLVYAYKRKVGQIATNEATMSKFANAKILKKRKN